MKVPYLSEQQIEARANEVLAAYGRVSKAPVSLPVPIEKIAHAVLDLSVEWTPLASLPGRQAVSKVVQPTLGVPAHIILNSDLLETTFRECPGLEQTAIGHEAGHGVFHLDRGRVHQLDLGLELGEEFVSDTASLTDKLGEMLGQFDPDGDAWWREWQAHTFMRYVLMPQWLLLPLLDDGGYERSTGRGGLYDLQARCKVTISALVVHLSKLGYISVNDRKEIHVLSPLAKGQLAMGE